MYDGGPAWKEVQVLATEVVLSKDFTNKQTNSFKSEVWSKNCDVHVGPKICSVCSP